MKIDSKPYGEIEIDEDKIVTIEDGLFGFEEREKYVIIGKEEEQPFEWLQAVEQQDLAFVIVQPQIIRPDYQLSVLPEDYRDIEVETKEDFSIYTIVVVPDDPDEMTVNFRGPVLINQENLVGKQVVNQIEEYSVRHKVLDELQATGEEGLVAEGGGA